MKKSLCILLAVILAVTVFVPTLAVSAAQVEEQVELIEGTYAPNQVIVMFQDSAIDTDTVSRKEDLASVGADFGEMMSAFSSEDEAAAAADDELDILAKSLGDDFTLEDTLVFSENVPASDGDLAPSGASGGEQSGELSIALVSSQKYDTKTLIKKLSSNDKIAYVEPNQYIHLTDFDDYSLNDTYASYLYQLNNPAAKNTGGDSVDDRGTEPEDARSMNPASGWKKLTGEEDQIVIAVVDTGVLSTHEDLKDRMWTNPGDIGLQGEHGYNFMENNENTDYDDIGHGTHCAGMIAAEANNATGVAGASGNADVKIMALRILGEKRSSTIYQSFGAFDYMLKAKQNGVNLVASNNSWGGAYYSNLLNEIIDRVGEAGVLTIIASGNEDHDLERVFSYPCGAESDYTVVVGAADITGKPTGFTNYGKTTVDLFAPGMNILSTVAYESYFPSIYSAQELNDTTEYYGEFSADTVIADGTVTPTTGEKAGEGIKSFGALQYVKQSCLDDPDAQIADDAQLELSLVSGRHFVSENPYRLKITIHNAQYGEEYFFWFPYEKNPLTTGDDNTRFSATYETGETEVGAHKSRISVGDVYQDDDGSMVVTNGGVLGSYISYDRIAMQRHPTNGLELGQEAPPSRLLSAGDAQGKQIGFGFSISCKEDGNMLWKEGEVHELTLYLDSFAIAKPGTQFDKNKAYDVMSGTSMACPAATGATALLAALDPKEDDQSPAEYAQALREKLFSCVRTTDTFADLCSTGGYIDLSLIDAKIPTIANAVCDVDNETITLYGENLTEDNTLTYRSLTADGDDAAALPDDMTLSYSDDGKTLVIQNAKPLFSTYTEFIMTTPDGNTGKGKFFLVKGQRQLDLVGSRIDQTSYPITPILFTDAKGSALFGYQPNTGQVAKIDGSQYEYLADTDLQYALKKYLSENGMSMYDLLNNADYRFGVLDTGYPLADGNTLYGFAIFGDIGTKESAMYLAQLDLSEERPQWTFEEIDVIPDELDYRFDKPLTITIYNGAIYIFSDPDEEGKCLMYSLSEDGVWNAQPDMPCGSISPTVREHSGKLYYLLGSSDEGDPITDVYCYDGEKWEKVGNIPYIGRVNVQNGYAFYYQPITAAKNGFIFLNASVDGGGNAFLYNTETNQVEPLYYTTGDTIRDCYLQEASCAATKDGVYFIRYNTVESVYYGYDLYLLPSDSGAYQSLFEDEIILGDADGDGKVTVLDATAIQKKLASIEPASFSEKAADVDGDGKVTVLDATLIQKWLANLPAPEGIGKPIA